MPWPRVPRPPLRSFLGLWTALQLVAAGCAPPATRPGRAGSPVAATTDALPSAAAGTATPTSGRPQIPLAPGATDGALVLGTPPVTVASSAATLAPMPDDATAALLARLEPLPEGAEADRGAPPVRPPSAAPARPGPIQPIAMVGPGGRVIPDQPPSAKPPTGAVAAPLMPPDIQPQGAVRAESEIRVRFSEPMVPVAALGPTTTAPATITPAVAGHWRWLDTRVALFTTEAPRLPQATTFTVTVPAGLRAVSGAALAAEARAQLTTAPVSINRVLPRGVYRTDSAIALGFDQRVDPAAMARFIRVYRDGTHTVPFRVVGFDEAMATWRRNPSLAAAIEPMSPATLGAALVIAPKTTWPAGAELRVVLAAGAPSLEGPLPSAGDSAVAIDIAAPFRAVGLRCGDDDRSRLTGVRCPANDTVSVELSNPLDERYRSEQVQLAGVTLTDNARSWSSVHLAIPPGAGRSHTVVLADSLRDAYDQPLTGPRRLPFTTGPEVFVPYANIPGGVMVLDPRFAIPQWILEVAAVRAVRVDLYQVTPADYFAYERFEQGLRSTPPGRRVSSTTYPVGLRRGAHVRVDLRPALAASGLGHVLAVASLSGAGLARAWVPARTSAWLQVTRLGLSARLDGEAVQVWTHDLAPARILAPVAGASVALVVDGEAALPAVTTDADGHAAFALPAARSPTRTEPSARLEVAAGEDRAFAVLDGHRRAIRVERALWYVTDDRFLYKPGEEVHVKGWVRWTSNGVDPDLALPAAGEVVHYELTDSRGVKLGAGEAALSDQGGFDAAIALPTSANLGVAVLDVSSRGATYRHTVQLREFRTPAFAVALDDDVTHRGATPLFAGEQLELSTTAGYYAGGGLPGATVTWAAQLAAASYRPPGWDAYGFEPAGPRAVGRGRDDEPAPLAVTRAAVLGGTSTAGLTVDVPAVPRGRPAILTVDATVTDVDRMSIRASSRPIVVHPSRYYVGVRAQAGERGGLGLVVVDVDGEPVPGVPLDVVLEGVLGSEIYNDDAVVRDSQRCHLTSAATPVTCAWRPVDDKLAYRAIATVTDERGRVAATAYRVPWWSHGDHPASLAIVADRPSYRPGDVAHLAIHSAITPATAILTVARQGVIEERRLALSTPVTMVDLPVEERWVQNVHVVVDRFAPRADSRAPAAGPLPGHATASAELSVDVEALRLSLRARPTEPLIEPGAPATFEVEVRKDDQPVAGAEVALMVVDEAVLALTAGHHADPLPGFYRKVAAGTSAHSTLSMIDDAGPDVLGLPGVDRYDLEEAGLGLSGYGLGGAGSGGTIGTGRYGTVGHGGVVAARKDFRATAAFSPRLHTDADGKVRLTVTMPDSLTRFRVVALATARTRWFGQGEGTVVTQRKLSARTVAPRFLTVGDRFSLPVVVQNLDRAPRTIDVAARAANLTALGPAGHRVTVPGGQRAEVRFDFATAGRGEAIIQTIAASGPAVDANQVAVPVYEPATTEAFATYGTVDDGAAFEQLVVPTDVFPEVGGVEVELASTQLQSLTDAYGYLFAYPYECAEQRSARMLATAAMTDVLDAFAVPGRPTRAELDARLAADLRALADTQGADGGWGYWPGLESEPFVTAQVLRALDARGAPLRLVASATKAVARSLAPRLTRIERAAALPIAARTAAVGPYEVSLAATELEALAATGRDEVARALRLHAAATALGIYPLDARARLLALVAGRPAAAAARAELLRQLIGATHETAAAATVTTSFVPAERLLLVSEHRTTALVLAALLREAPDHALVTKLAHGLLDARTRGRWVSTQENLVVLEALRRYFDVHERVTPDFVGKVWFGAAAYAEESFVGRSRVRAQAALGWTELAPGTRHDLSLVKEGAGRMYYRVGIRYAPRRVDLPPLDAGFVVRRGYAALDSPDDVRRTTGGWTIRLGARVRVTVEVVVTSERHQVAVVDPLPAAFEIVDAALATAERDVPRDDHRWNHRNLRDDRAEAFALELPAGAYRMSYTVRATTPGLFVAAPARAEQMYEPETFGRSAGAAVTVE